MITSCLLHFFLRVITHRGVAKKSSQSPTISIRSSNINNTGPVIQSTNSNAIASDISLNASPPTTRINNANMPQPPPSTSQAILSLAVSSGINQDIYPTNELEKSNKKIEEQSILGNKATINTKEFTDENDYPRNLLYSKRQSQRITRSKRANTTSSTISSVGKKKKK